MHNIHDIDVVCSTYCLEAMHMYNKKTRVLQK